MLHEALLPCLNPSYIFYFHLMLILSRFSVLIFHSQSAVVMRSRSKVKHASKLKTDIHLQLLQITLYV